MANIPSIEDILKTDFRVDMSGMMIASNVEYGKLIQLADKALGASRDKRIAQTSDLKECYDKGLFYDAKEYSTAGGNKLTITNGINEDLANKMKKQGLRAQSQMKLIETSTPQTIVGREQRARDDFKPWLANVVSENKDGAYFITLQQDPIAVYQRK